MHRVVDVKDDYYIFDDSDYDLLTNNDEIIVYNEEEQNEEMFSFASNEEVLAFIKQLFALWIISILRHKKRRFRIRRKIFLANILYEGEIAMQKVQFTETVLRDANQSLIATRMKFNEFEPILSKLDKAGYYSLECWGGATFDSCLRYLDEDPWERLRKIRKAMPNTRLQMLLRGQNLLGYKHYVDDVVDAFVKKSIENGIDVIRIFDALNDKRNLEQAIKCCKKYGGICEATICYTSAVVDGKEVFTNEYFA